MEGWREGGMEGRREGGKEGRKKVLEVVIVAVQILFSTLLKANLA